MAAKRAVKLGVTYRAVESLIPYARNARVHPESQIAALAGSIKEFGFNQPVLVDGDSGILAGHGRVLAAKKLGLDKVPCIELGHLSETAKRAYVLADNKLAEQANWDKDTLQLEACDLQGLGVDLFSVGFKAVELEALTAKTEPVPQLPKSDRRPSQQMGFTIHDDQVDVVSRALAFAKQAGPFTGSNTNANGNALYRICETYLAVKEA